MQIYKTIRDPSTGAGLSWQSSQTEASKARAALKKEGFKPETVTVNIPTAKGPLIEWLNENVTA
jgi:hypothetical protein